MTFFGVCVVIVVKMDPGNFKNGVESTVLDVVVIGSGILGTSQLPMPRYAATVERVEPSSWHSVYMRHSSPFRVNQVKLLNRYLNSYMSVNWNTPRDDLEMSTVYRAVYRYLPFVRRLHRG